MAESYESSDYAGMVSKNISFYYGYEEIDADENWLFYAEIDKEKLVSWTAKEIGVANSDKWSPQLVLVAGIAKFFDIWSVNTDYE